MQDLIIVVIAGAAATVKGENATYSTNLQRQKAISTECL